MTAVAGSTASELTTTKHSWTPAVLSAGGSHRRNRRTIDAVLLAAGALITGLAAVLAASAPETDEAVAEALTTILGWAEPFWRIAFLGAIAFALVIAIEVVVHRR